MRPIDYAALTEKECSTCGLTKAVSEFNRYTDPKAKLTGWRYYSQCRGCSNALSRRYGAENRSKRNERLKRWRAGNPERARLLDRAKRLKQKYGLTIAEAEELLSANNGRCLICNTADAVAIDHDHATGKVRGALCLSCNTFLGRVEANPTILNRMSAYAGLDQLCHADVLLELANGL